MKKLILTVTTFLVLGFLQGRLCGKEDDLLKAVDNLRKTNN